MNTERKIFLNTLYQMLGKLSTTLLGVISFAFLARYLNEQFGIYVLISTFVGFVVVFADFGLGTLLTREVANKRADNKYISNVYTLRLILSLLAAIIGSIFIFFFPYSLTIKIGVIILSFANIFYLLAATIWAIFQAKLLFDKVVVSQVISSFATCILIILGVFLKFPLLYFIATSGAGIIIGFIIAYLMFDAPIKLTINNKAFVSILKESWPIGAGVIVSVVYFKIDSLILPYFYNPSTFPDLGYYATAYKIFEVAMVFGGYFTATLFPIFSENLYTKKFMLHFYKYLSYTLILAVSANVFLFIFAEIFVVVLGGESFFPAVKSLQILSFAASTSILSGFFLNIGIAGRQQILIFKYALIIAILNIILNLILIPKYSFIGASIITVFTQFFILVSYIYISIIVIKNRGLEIPK